jgi:hypothetical protein
LFDDALARLQLAQQDCLAQLVRHLVTQRPAQGARSVEILKTLFHDSLSSRTSTIRLPVLFIT